MNKNFIKGITSGYLEKTAQGSKELAEQYNAWQQEKYQKAMEEYGEKEPQMVEDILPYTQMLGPVGGGGLGLLLGNLLKDKSESQWRDIIPYLTMALGAGGGGLLSGQLAKGLGEAVVTEPSEPWSLPEEFVESLNQ